MASSSGSDQPVTWTEYSEPRCCQCSQQSKCSRDEYCACHSKHVHCTNCLAHSCTNRNILLGPAVEPHVPPYHNQPPQASHGTLPAHLPPQASHGTLPAHLPPQVSHGTLPAHLPPQASHGTLPAHLPPQVSHGTLPAHLPPQVSHGTLSTHLPPQVSHGTLPAHLPPQVSHGTLPPPSLTHGDISWNRVVQSAPSRSGNQATPSPHQPMLVSHSGGQTDYLSYPSSRATVSGGQVSSPSPAHVNPSWNQVTTFSSPNLSVVQPETLVRYFNPSSSQLSPQGMQTVYTRSEVAPVHPTGNRTIVLPHQSSWTQVAGSQSTRPQQLHVDPAYTQDSLFQPSVSRVLPSGSHTTPAISRTVLARAQSVQATHLQPSSSQVSPSPNQDTPLTSKVSAVTSSDHRETLVSPLSSHIILSGRSTFPQSATPSLSSGEKEGESSVHDAQFVSSDAAITGASTHQSDKSITSSPASKASGGSRCCPCNWKSKCMVARFCPCRTKKVRCTSCLSERCSNRDIVQTSKKDRCCECTDTSQCSKTRSCDCLSRRLPCANCVAEKCSNICCPCGEGSNCTKNDNCKCRIKDRRCFGRCLATCCTNYKKTNTIHVCCRCNDESECNTKNCDCHARGKQCTNCPAKRCQSRCCQCTEGCNRNENCACRSTHTRCSANCLTKECTNHKMTTALTECCQCNEESDCNSNNCACHSRHTRCSANCFAGGCTNSKLTGECKECCRCNEESQCDSENCACRSKYSHCSSRCFATGCGNHKTVMGQKVDPYLSKKQVQVLAKSQATSDAERKTTRPITHDTTQTSSIPASCQGSAPDNETEFLNAWFPCLDTQPYIIPPVHFDTVHVRKVNLAGGHSIKVLKTQEEREQGQDKSANKTAKIDRILQKIHYCLSHIKQEAAKQRELMVIMSQAKCSLYGANSTSLYTGAAAMSTNSSDREALDLREEFVDLLVIHRQQGILMAATIPTSRVRRKYNI